MRLPTASFYIFIVCFFLVLADKLSAQVNITMYKNDTAHTGQNLSETQLTPAALEKSGNFGLLFNQTVDGQVYAQPLYVSGLKFPDGSVHNVVFIATQHDSVFAFDADNNSGANSKPLWQTSFLAPPASPLAGVTYDSDGNYTILTGPDAANSNDQNYANTSDITVEIGITTTPVIDPATNTLYVVSKSSTGTGSTTVQYLHALDITTGLDKMPKQIINPTFAGTGAGSVGGQITFDPLREHLRASMVIYGGIVYLAYASHSDQPNYHGIILGYNESNLAFVKSFIDTPNGDDGGIWAAGCGPAIDSTGNMFVTTGNGSYDQNVTNEYDWSETFLKLPTTGTFNVANLSTDFFTPNNQAALTSADADLGSSGVLLLPDQTGPHTHIMISGGKADVMYVVDRDILGGNVPSGQKDNVVQEINESHRLFCSPSYFNGYVYYAPETSNLLSRQVSYNASTGNYLSTSPVSSKESFSAHGSSPFISANGAQNGLLWIINDGIPSTLYAYDATAFSTSTTSPVSSIYNYPLVYNGSINDTANKFTIPIVDNGKVYLTAYDPPTTTVSTASDPHPTTVAHLYVFGLLATATSIPAAPTLLTATATSSTEVTLNWVDNSNNESGFEILRSTSATGPFTQVGLAGANFTSYSDTGVSANTSYYYQVAATNSLGTSAPTNTASVRTFSPYSPAGLIGYWNCDEGSGSTVFDVTGHGYNGTLNGEVNFTTGFIGLSALTFHGTGNAVANATIPDSPSLRFAANQSFTISAWVLESATRTTDEGVICKSRETGNYYGIWINASGNQWVFRGPGGDVVGPVAQSAWTHVAAVQDSVAGKRYLYINGVLAATGPAQAADGTGDLWFGQANSVENPFPGDLDEVRIYNRALPASEITTLMGPPVLASYSLQTQGQSGGSYGVILPVDGTTATEPREGSPEGSYNLQLTFSSPVSGISASLGLQAGQTGSAVGSVSNVAYDGTKNIVTVSLTGVGNAQSLNLHLSGIVPGNGTADIPFNVLWGDANGDGIVNQQDVALVNAYLNSAVTNATSNYDFNCDGEINSTDANIAIQNEGRHLGSSFNYLANPSLEYNTSGIVFNTKVYGGFSTVAGWQNSGTIYNNSGLDYAGDASNTAEDGSVLAFAETGDSGAYQVSNYVMTAGDQVTLTWWAKASSGNAGQLVSLLSGTSPSSSFSALTTLASSGAALSSTGNSGAFTQYSVTYTATAADEGHYVAVAFMANTGSGWATFDNFALTVQPTNLLMNPSFEVNTSGAVFDTKVYGGFSTVEGWQNAGTTYNNTGIDYVGDGGNTAETGNALVFAETGDSGAYQITNHALNAGDQVTLTWWAKTSDGTAGQSVSLLSSASTSSAFSSLTTLATSTAALTNTGNSGAFTEYTLTYTATSADQGRYVAVGFRSTGNGGSWATFDDFALIDNPTNLLTNASFEYNTSGTVFSSKVYGGFSTVQGWLNAGSTYNNSGVDYAGDGGKIAENGNVFVFAETGDSGAYQITNHAMVTGEQITLTWWAKSSSGTAGQVVNLLSGTSTGSSFSTLTTLATSTAALNATGAGAYSLYTLTYTATAEDQGHFLAVGFKASATPVSNWASFDNFSLSSVP